MSIPAGCSPCQCCWRSIWLTGLGWRRVLRRGPHARRAPSPLIFAMKHKLDRSIDIDTYDRHADRVREEMTLLKIDEHTSTLEEPDVEAFWRSLTRLAAGASIAR